MVAGSLNLGAALSHKNLIFAKLYISLLWLQKFVYTAYNLWLTSETIQEFTNEHGLTLTECKNYVWCVNDSMVRHVCRIPQIHCGHFGNFCFATVAVLSLAIYTDLSLVPRVVLIPLRIATKLSMTNSESILEN